jgi:hypothetical protein
MTTERNTGANTTETDQGTPPKQDELRDDELKEATGGVYVGPSQSAKLIGLLVPRR